MDDAKKDFFVSYNSHDESWAEWVAFQLETAGYSTILQKWDFRPRTNFVLEMDEAAKRAERTILVMSASYVGSNFTPSERAAGFARDPRGLERRLIPVFVESVDVQGFLSQVVHINIVGRDPGEATKLLLEGTSHPGPGPGPGPGLLALPAVSFSRRHHQPGLARMTRELGSLDRLHRPRHP